MTGILLLIRIIYRNNTYLRNKKLFVYFFLNSWNPYETLNILKKNMALIAYVFPKKRTAKDAELNWIESLYFMFSCWQENTSTISRSYRKVYV